MSIMAFPTTGHRLFVQQLIQAYNKDHTSDSCYWPFARRNHRDRCFFHHKGEQCAKHFHIFAIMESRAWGDGRVILETHTHTLVHLSHQMHPDLLSIWLRQSDNIRQIKAVAKDDKNIGVLTRVANISAYMTQATLHNWEQNKKLKYCSPPIVKLYELLLLCYPSYTHHSYKFAHVCHEEYITLRHNEAHQLVQKFTVS